MNIRPPIQNGGSHRDAVTDHPDDTVQARPPPVNPYGLDACQSLTVADDELLVPSADPPAVAGHHI